MNILDAQLKSIDGTLHVKLSDGTALPIPKERTPRSSKDGDMVRFGIRPEDVKMDSNGPVSGTVSFVESLGREDLVVCLVGGQRVQLLTEPGKRIGLDTSISFSIDMNLAHFFDANTEQTLLWE
jgi:ABC-type sugar transport system ATPase subunit